MEGWVGHVGWPIADSITTKCSTIQLAVWRRIGKVGRPRPEFSAKTAQCNRRGQTAAPWTTESTAVNVVSHPVSSGIGHHQGIIGSLSQIAYCSPEMRSMSSTFALWKTALVAEAIADKCSMVSVLLFAADTCDTALNRWGTRLDNIACHAFSWD